ncbi:MAG: hypothetical protein AAB785_00180 [Patescibacteria group bacterium]
MSKLSTKERTIFKYLILAIAVGFLIIISKLFPIALATSPVFLIFALFLLLFPGWFLSRLIKIETYNITSQLVISFSLSLSFYLLVNLIAIFLGLNIEGLLWVYYILLPILFLAALTSDLWQDKTWPAFKLKTIFQKENLLLLLPIVFGTIIILVIDAKGADFNGDPYFHLAIMRKAIEGQPLTLNNLAFIKVYEPNPAYAFPAWQIFLGVISKVTALDIFTVWAKMILPLTLLSFFSWYYLSKTIFPNRTFQIISLLFFMIFIFGPSAGYIFQRLSVPDSFARLVVAPLVLALGLEYFLNKKISWKILLVFGLGAINLLIIHGMHYFYLLLLLLCFFILWSAFSFKDSGFFSNLKRGLLVLGAAILPATVLTIILEVKSKIISVSLSHFRAAAPANLAYLNFGKYPLIYKYGYFLLPIVVLFRKNRPLVFILSSMIIAPLVYWTPLKDYLSSFLSQVFVDRLLVNTSLYFLVFSLLIGFLVVKVENNLSRYFKTSWLPALFLTILLTFFVLLEINNKTFSSFGDSYFYSRKISQSISASSLSIFLVISILAFLIYIYEKFKSKKDYFLLPEFKNQLAGFILIILLSFVLFAPAFTKTFASLKSSRFFSSRDFSQKAYALSDIGYDPGGIEFLKSQIPPKSVILADKLASRSIAMLSDHYLAYNLGSFREGKLTAVFTNDLSDNEKEIILFSPKYAIDYIFLRLPDAQGDEYFSQHPELYQKVYDSKVQIYKVFK